MMENDIGRYIALTGMLEGRKREILKDRGASRRENPRDGKRVAPPEEVDIQQEDIEYALWQMRGETLNKIDEALGRLEKEAYGLCFDCGGEISGERLCALPFAIRCKPCEEARDAALARERLLAQRRTPLRSIFEDG